MQEAPALTPVVLSSLSGIASAVIAGSVTAAVKSRELNTQFENRKKEIAAQHEQQVVADRERTRAEFVRDQVLADWPRRLPSSKSVLSTFSSGSTHVPTFSSGSSHFVVNSLEEMKKRSESRDDVERFLASCASEWHHYAATTLYPTAVYLANAARYRDPSRPFIAEVAALDAAVERVRSELDGEFAFWTENQDSIGLQMLRPDRGVLTFREFLEHWWIRPNTSGICVWLDAFCDVDSVETRAMLERGVASLTALTETAEAFLRADHQTGT